MPGTPLTVMPPDPWAHQPDWHRVDALSHLYVSDVSAWRFTSPSLGEVESNDGGDMPIRLNQNLCAYLADSITGALYGGVLRVYTGSQPGDADAAPTGTLLVEIPIVNGWDAAAPGGGAILAGAESGVAVGSGAPGWARLSAGDCSMDGGVGTSVAADFVIDKADILAGETVSLLGATLMFAEAQDQTVVIGDSGGSGDSGGAGTISRAEWASAPPGTLIQFDLGGAAQPVLYRLGSDLASRVFAESFGNGAYYFLALRQNGDFVRYVSSLLGLPLPDAPTVKASGVTSASSFGQIRQMENHYFDAAVRLNGGSGIVHYRHRTAVLTPGEPVMDPVPPMPSGVSIVASAAFFHRMASPAEVLLLGSDGALYVASIWGYGDPQRSSVQANIGHAMTLAADGGYADTYKIPTLGANITEVNFGCYKTADGQWHPLEQGKYALNAITLALGGVAPSHCTVGANGRVLAVR